MPAGNLDFYDDERGCVKVDRFEGGMDDERRRGRQRRRNVYLSARR